MKSAILVASMILTAHANAAEIPAGTTAVKLNELQSPTQAEVIKSLEADIEVMETNRNVAQNQAQVAQSMRIASGNAVVNFGALQDVHELRQVELEKKREDLQGQLNVQRKLEAEYLRTHSK